LYDKRIVNPETIISARVIVEYEHMIALLRRVPSGEFPAGWELPGGKQEPTDATILDTAVRETKEETGLDVEVLDFSATHVDTRLLFDGKNAGRPYQAFGVLALAPCREIVIDPHEHTESMWLPAADALGLDTLTRASRKTIVALGPLLTQPLK
jgi:8-oxo-dGTP pyrophosphatase MutT (NUDIX family)